MCNICLSVSVSVRECRCVYVCYGHTTRGRYSAARFLFLCLVGLEEEEEKDDILLLVFCFFVWLV